MLRPLGSRLAAGIVGLALTFVAIGIAQGEALVWHIKAVHPTGMLLDVKAMDAEGNAHDIKAIEQAGNRYLLDIKAFVDGQVLSIKVLAEDDWFGPVKAVDGEGRILDVKAVTADGELLDIKAVSRAGHILDIKAMGPDRQFLGIKAVSPDGAVYDVKGIKLSDEQVEMELGGVGIRAHVKAFPQIR